MAALRALTTAASAAGGADDGSAGFDDLITAITGTTTRVPTLTRLYRSVMSALCMRMQPCDTNLPIEPSLLVPWMAYWPPPDSVIAATPIGFCGEPPGTTAGSLL